MRIIEAIECLEESKEFKDWMKKHKDAYLVHGFQMRDKEVKSEWQLGFYIPKKNKVVTWFIMDEIKHSPESEVFQEKKHKIPALKVEEVKITLEKALEKMYEFAKKEYPAETPGKIIAILQNTELGQVWNVTFVTASIKTLNIKMDSSSGEIIKHTLQKLFDFKA